MTRGTRPSKEARERAIELLWADVPIYTISDKVGISPETLYQWVRKLSIPRTINRETPTGTCLAHGCERPVVTKKMCNMHFQRMSLHGSVIGNRQSIEAKFLSRVFLDDSGCALWTGGKIKSKEGRYYGHFAAFGETLAHRVSYRMYIGEIPEGYQVDHLCSVTLCVWPEHLEAVTPEENVRRTIERGRAAWQLPGWKPSPRKKNQKGQFVSKDDEPMTALELGAWAFGARV